MLSPRERQLLLETLRPAEGYRLDFAVGTSYSLDLIALLVVPLAFTFHDWEDDDGRTSHEPLALLESVRRHAENMVLYCQVGEISVPGFGQPLVAYLERCIVEVRAPNEGGVFHPKIWLLRYVRAGEPTRYRFLCLSRNLTFDRCWDSLLSLDGELVDRANAYSVNHPLGDFIARLPSLSARSQGDRHAQKVAQIASEVRRVRFEPPPDAVSFAFHPLGLGIRSTLPVGTRRGPLLVMSPFVSASLLKSLVEKGTVETLISRPDELSHLPPSLIERLNGKNYVLDGAAEEIADEASSTSGPSLSGLHAKLFIEEDGWDAHVFTGSANATDAAFNRNVEFMTELVGKRSKLGIQSFMEGRGDGQTGIHQILKPWSGIAAPLSEEERIRKALEDRLTEARRSLAIQPMTLRCSPASNDGFSLEVHTAACLILPDGITVRCWPGMYKPSTAIALSPGPGLVGVFGPMELVHVTAFLAFELGVAQGDISARSTFAVHLPLEGLPEDRLQRLLASQLRDPTQLLRLLWLLLQPDAGGSVDLVAQGLNGNANWPYQGAEVWPIFEHLIRNVVDSEQRAHDIGRLIEDLARTVEGKELVPTGLLELWSTVKRWMEERRVARG